MSRGQRLGVLRSMTVELGLSASVELVRSESNKADMLKMVKRVWLMKGAHVICG